MKRSRTGRQTRQRDGASIYAFVFMSRLHCARNVLRALPCNPLALACFEHSREIALRAFAGAFIFGTVFETAGGVAVVEGVAGVV